MQTTKERGDLDPEKGPKVKFARFVDGELILFSAYTTVLEYVAVSHVFGKTEWLSIPGIKNEVLASTQKAAFIEKELPALIGDRAFWMDILTVDQRNQAEVISVVSAIPWIFRNAVQTLAIREDDAIYSCCEKALEGIQDWKTWTRALGDHHDNHIGEICDESYLQRLWTFQECLLSHSIRFVVCRREHHSKEEGDALDGLYNHPNDLTRFHNSLWVLFYCFSSNAKAELSPDDFDEFVDAYIHGKTITRSKPKARTVAEDIYTGDFVAENLGSQRAASEPRDYIFATMPPFPWYKYPTNAENMAFGELFVDLYNQAAENRHTFAPKFTASMTHSTATDTSKAWLPSKQQPEPECLGDFLKLLGQRLTIDSPTNIPFNVTGCVRVLPIHEDTGIEFLPMIRSAMKFSKRAWQDCHQGGELSKYGSCPKSSWELDVTDAASMGWWRDPEKSKGPHIRVMMDRENLILTKGPSIEFKTLPAEPPGPGSILLSSVFDHNVDYVPILEHSRSILDIAWCASEYVRDLKKVAYFKTFLDKMEWRWSKPLLQTLILLIAMVNCRIGLSAARWVRKYFVPAVIQYDKDTEVIGLLARGSYLWGDLRSKQMMSVSRHVHGPSVGKDLVLVDFAMPSAPVGLIPDVVYDGYEAEDYASRMQVVFHGRGEVVASREVKVPCMCSESYAAIMQKWIQELGSSTAEFPRGQFAPSNLSSKVRRSASF